MLLRMLNEVVRHCRSWPGSRRTRAPPAACAHGSTQAAQPAQLTQSRQAVIDALPSSIALLDADGVILLVNKAWRRGASVNAMRRPEFCIGLNYLQVCLPDTGAHNSEAAMREVLARTLPGFTRDYPCHSGDEEHWFELMVAPLTDPPLAGALVIHRDITLHKLAERKLVRSALRLEQAHVGTWEFDLSTMRAVLSDEMCRLSYCPVPAAGLDCSAFLALAHPADRAALQRALCPAADAAAQVTLEYRTDPALGPERMMRAVVDLDRAVDGRLLRTTGTARDVSERLRGQLLGARMAAIVDASQDAIIGKDMSGRITSWNAGAERIFGYPASEMLGQSILRLIPDDRQAEDADILRRLMAGQRIDNYLTSRLTRHGRRIDVSLSITPVKDGQGNSVGASLVLRDISERRQINLKLQRDAERLQRLSRRLMTTEEEERRRLGRDLHDQTGSNLTAITLNLQILRGKLPPPLAAELKQRFDDIESLLRGTILQIRDVLSNLLPPALEEFGLLAALRYHVQRLAAHSDLKLEVNGQEPSPRMPPQVEIALFRIAQEALTNVLKHAQARCVTLVLSRVGGRIRLRIQDDGRGFDCDNNRSAPNSLGMATMHERAQAIGAELQLRSAPGAGTRITVEVMHRAADHPAAMTEMSAA